jgi:DEAD/DEAH box helicase domain-containing protein
MRKIFFDIETRNTFQEANTNDPADLDISVVCIYDTETETATSYLQEELPKLWPIIEKADSLIGYNSEHFDMPLLNKYYAGDLSKIKHVDLLKEIKASLGRRIKLDDVADATLGRKKIAHGLEAIEWWKSGEIDKIIKYCIEDVMITKAVYDYAMKNRKLKYKEFGKLKDIPLDPSNWETKEDTSMTFSLPF